MLQSFCCLSGFPPLQSCPISREMARAYGCQRTVLVTSVGCPSHSPSMMQHPCFGSMRDVLHYPDQGQNRKPGRGAERTATPTGDTRWTWCPGVPGFMSTLHLAPATQFVRKKVVPLYRWAKLWPQEARLCQISQPNSTETRKPTSQPSDHRDCALTGQQCQLMVR